MKYIDAEKLITEIEKRKYEVFPTNDGKVRACSTPDQLQSGWLNALAWMLRRITSLQQEQPDLPGIEKSGIPGKDYIPVEWVDACEMYGKWKIVKQEQPEMDLEKVCDAYCKICGHYSHATPTYICRQACDYFKDFKALLNARKEE